MTRNDVIETLADYYGLDYPEMKENGEYDLRNNYDWQAGCAMNGGYWLTLSDVVYALRDYYDE